MATKSQIAKLKSKAKVIGIDADALVEELTDEVVSRLPQPQVDMDALAQVLLLRLEGAIAAKLEEVIAAVQPNPGEKVDGQALVQGVAKLLEPQIVEAAKKAADAVFEANRQALLKQIQEKLPQNPQATEASPAGQNPGQGLSLREILNFTLSNASDIAKLIEAVRPKQSPLQQLAFEVTRAFRLADIIAKAKDGKIGVEEIEKSIAALPSGSKP